MEKLSRHSLATSLNQNYYVLISRIVKLKLLNNYLSILKTPQAKSTFGFGTLGRISFGSAPVALVLTISKLQNSFSIAGIAAGIFTFAGALFVPRIGRLADQLGARKVLLSISIINLMSLIYLIVFAKHRDWEVYLGAALTGATFPNFGSYTRTRWGRLFSDQNLLTSVLSLESVLDELGFVVGPALAGVLYAAFSPTAPLYCVVILMIIAGVGLALTGEDFKEKEIRGKSTTSLYSIPHFRPLLISLVFLGVVFGGSTVSIVAAAKISHIDRLSGILVSLYALGSLIAGAWYGTKAWKSPIGLRYFATLCIMSVSTSVLWIFRSGSFLWLTVIIAGCVISPTLIAANSFMKAIVPIDRLTESFSFIGAAISFGITIGSVISGWLVNHFGAWNSFYSLTISAALAALVSWIGVAPNKEHR